ncbi:MAG: SPFH domain-containing protein [Isosphaeraceae bacterium]
MFNYSISALIFVLLLVIGGAIAAAVGFAGYPAIAVLGVVAWVPLDFLISSSVRMAAQWEKAVVFRLGRYKDMRGPGLFLVLPVIEQVRIIDTRVVSVNIPKQQVITRDNVPVTIDGVLFFRVANAAEAIISVQDYKYSVSNYAQTSLRDVIGQMTLDQLLTEREEIAHMIENHVEKDTKGWGLDITGLRIQDIDMPEELKKMMSAGVGRAREAGDHHQGRGRQGGRHQPGRRRPDDGRKPRRDDAADAANGRRPGPVRVEHGRAGDPDRDHRVPARRQEGRRLRRCPT